MKKLVMLLALFSFCCFNISAQTTNDFGTDKAFLLQNTDAIVLSNISHDQQIVVVPEYQGRVMTSTASGDSGISFGWLNYDLISSHKLIPHMNTFGGEDRFWMGPEGGQFGLYFPEHSAFTLDNWQVPAAFDTDKFQVVSKTTNTIIFNKNLTLENYSGNNFAIKVVRSINLLTKTIAAHTLKIKIPNNVKVIAYQTNNKITNVGKNTWNKKTGLLSIWILGNYVPSPTTKIILPIKSGSDHKLGKSVNIYDSFGTIPNDRLIVKRDYVSFKADGKMRGKIGLNPKRAKNILGSYDAAKNILTIVKYNKPKNTTSYVNSAWEIQKDPYSGDVVNAYNDGPLGNDMKQLGPFYELETSSPALALKPGASFTHIRYTFHFIGKKADLDKIARKVFGVSLDEIAKTGEA